MSTRVHLLLLLFRLLLFRLLLFRLLLLRLLLLLYVSIYTCMLVTVSIFMLLGSVVQKKRNKVGRDKSDLLNILYNTKISWETQ